MSEVYLCDDLPPVRRTGGTIVRSILHPRGRAAAREPLFGVTPVDDVPECCDEFRATILVFHVVRVLPDVEDEDRGGFVAEHHFVILELDDVQLLRACWNASATQPLAKCFAAASLNFVRNASTEPKSLLERGRQRAAWRAR